MTAPVNTPPTCSLWVNGSRFADGQVGEADDQPVALTDLRVVWGRQSTLDQPSPSSCTFSVMDLAGGQAFRDTIGIGDRIEIRTEGAVFGPPSVPSLPATPLTNAYVTNGTIVKGSGWVTPTDPRKPVVVMIPPAALSSNPSAWNAIPRSAASQTWHASIVVTLQDDLGTRLQRATLAPVSYVNPSGAGSKILPAIGSAGPNVIGAQTISGDFQPPESVWVGLAVTLNPTGPVWNSLAAAPSWSSLGATPLWSDLNRMMLNPAAISLTAPPAGLAYAALVFSGRLTDMTARFDTSVGGTVVECIAQDETADLENRYVGESPWLAQTLAARFAAIVAASGSGVKYTVDAGPGALPVTWRDVDAQPTTRLLQELAISAAGVLWSASDLVSGPYLRLEDVAARAPLYRLVQTSPTVTNLFTRPSFEDSSTSAWQSSSNGTLTVSVPAAGFEAIPGRSGSKAMRVTAPAITTGTNINTVSSAWIPVVAGRIYRFTAYARLAVFNAGVSLRIDVGFKDAAGAVVGSNVGGSTYSPTDTKWGRLTCTATVPAGATQIQLYIRHTANPVAGVVSDWDAIMVHEVAAAGDPSLDYFDGDTVDTSDLFYDWTGARWLSSSIQAGAIVVIPASSTTGIELSACSLLLEPVQWTQATDDNSTQVVAAWFEQTLDDKGNPQPTSRSVVAVDYAEETRSGRRRIGVQTQLSTSVSAQQTADLMLARVRGPSWRISGLTWALGPYDALSSAELLATLRLLDGTTRLGVPILLTDLPSWSPVSGDAALPLFVEGGRYVNVNGYWTIEILVSDGKSQGAAAIPWNTVPAPWIWNQFDPSVSWSELSGVGL